MINLYTYTLPQTSRDISPSTTESATKNTTGKTAASNYHGDPPLIRVPPAFERRARNALEILAEMRAYYQRNFTDRLLTDAAFYFSFYSFIYGWNGNIVGKLRRGKKKGKKEQLMKRGVNSHSGNNNGGRKYNSKRKFNFYWRAGGEKARIAR